jgi:hypothetical protein
MSEPSPLVPLRFDMSDMVRRSVATLYSHLVTRPTGQALRLGIEAQISELGAVCLTVLDFTEVVVLDYSCADETLAKLIKRFQRDDRPAEAYFLARGIDDRHRETIEAVLGRQRLAVAAELADGERTVLGELSHTEREVWRALDRLARGAAADIARDARTAETDALEALESLARHRVVVRAASPHTYLALRPLLGEG